MKHTLENKCALITGGSRGIGAAIVKRLARDGAHVALTYVSKPAQANGTVKAAPELGVKALAIQADSANANAVVAAVEQAAAELGGLDILVNNAGIAVIAPIDDCGTGWKGSFATSPRAKSRLDPISTFLSDLTASPSPQEGTRQIPCIPRSGKKPSGVLTENGLMAQEESKSRNDAETKAPEESPSGREAASADAAAGPAQAAARNTPARSNGHRSKGRRRALKGGVGIVALAVALYFAMPAALRAFNTISTDDAYVNGHVTFVASRVAGQVTRVMVDDNNTVHKGDLLVELDKEPYKVQVEVKQAARERAQADLSAARALARGTLALARSRRWELQRAMEDVHNQVALLVARVAELKSRKAVLTRAQADFDRAKYLVERGATSRADYDLRQQDLSVAEAQVKVALENVYQIRAALGLPANPPKGESLAQVPPDLDQTFSSVLQAQAALIQTAAQLGIVHSFEETPKQMLDEFMKRAPHGDIDLLFAQLVDEAPEVKQAEAKLQQAEGDLAQAQLNLGYCDVIAEIDGVITRRNVNPGNNVEAGQGLMAIRSLREVWVDANFKETQLSGLRIGQRADLYVDMYGERHVFKGRISGFTMGTGSTLALLPAQNATGNFVKVVQRLPVRIELTDYDPEKGPLFVGLSVVAYVYYKEPPTGPDAGEILQPYVLSEPSGTRYGSRVEAKP